MVGAACSCSAHFSKHLHFPGGGFPWHVSRRARDASTCKARSVFLAEEVMPHPMFPAGIFAHRKLPCLCPPCQSIGQPCHEEHCHCTAVRPSHGIPHHLHILWGATCDQFQAHQDCYHESRCHRVSRCDGHMFFMLTSFS